MSFRCLISSLVFLGLVMSFLSCSSAASDQNSEPLPEDSDSPPAQAEAPESSKSYLSIEAVVVNPYRSANVGAQVPGVVQRFYFDEGDLVLEDQVVAEVEPRRYQLMVQRTKAKLKYMEMALKKALEEAQVKTEAFAFDATTRQEIIKAKAEAEMAQAKTDEAQKELELAVLDLDACKVKAPYSGYIAVRYKQPDETVDRLEKVFSLVDSSKVYAVANVPEAVLSRLKKGTEAQFIYPPDKRFKGVVDKVGKLIDPKSKTKRVYLLIDNSENDLEVGMTGTLQIAR
jgi:RND family efflux transporter MFP subunit